MRTQKRFTSDLLNRFEREGRGTKTYQDYIPWHRVGRGDPASQGRSHLELWRGRQRELLSDIELATLLFATMLPGIADIREQFPLSLDSSLYEGLDYDVRQGALGSFPGTVQIARALDTKHPVIREGASSTYWRMSTDLLIFLRPISDRIQLVAVSCKPSSKDLTKSARRKLAIEREYWNARSVPWLLITPEQYDESVRLTLMRSEPWVFRQPASDIEIELALRTAIDMNGHAFTRVIDVLAERIGSQERALRAFWQAVWGGVLPLDLRRGWRPHLPIQILPTPEFFALNPLYSRRTAWN
jgi:hypothetical protein